MKKASLLLFCAAIMSLAACQKDDTYSYKDSEITGETVDLSGFASEARKVFLLNEGGMGSNNASLDVLRFSDANYITGIFRKMNPDISAGLGDVGNDIAVCGNEVWMVINNSGIVEVISAKDETEIAAIEVPTPRNVAFDGTYAYVTSWSGSSYNDPSTNRKGCVYRINLKTKKIEGSVEVGYQPEGLAFYKGRLYVANSGGVASTVGPDYAYDKTVSVVSTSSFSVVKTIEVAVNLKNVYSDGEGRIYVTSFGNYGNVHSGLYMIDIENSDAVTAVGSYVSVSAIDGDTVYCIGTEMEFDWNATRTYTAWSVENGVKKAFPVSFPSVTPYGLCVIDDDTFLLADAGDYFNPGKLICYHNGVVRWTVTAGVCPAHFAIW